MIQFRVQVSNNAGSADYHRDAETVVLNTIPFIEIGTQWHGSMVVIHDGLDDFTGSGRNRIVGIPF